MKIFRFFKNKIKRILNDVFDIISAYLCNFSLFKIQSEFLISRKEKKVISFSLYGNDPKYFSNIDRCIQSYRKDFPEWIIRIYVSSDISELVLHKIKKYDCELIIMQSVGKDYRYTLWRFLALDDNDIVSLLIRDIDSKSSPREKKMVGHWLVSGKKLHIMRDHPGHIDLIMAGMWGIHINGIDQQFEKKMKGFKKTNKFGVDQDFLKQIYHYYSPDIFIHDIYKRFSFETPEILPHDSTLMYVGETVLSYEHKERHRNELIEFYSKKTATDEL